MNYKKQSQFELFSHKPPKANAPSSGPGLKSLELKLSFDNLIVLFIVFIMASVLFFSLGVEKGRKTVQPSPSQTVEAGATVLADAGQRKILDESEKTDMMGRPKGEPTKVTVVLEKDRLDRGQVEPLALNTDVLAQENKNIYTIQVASFRLRKNAQKEAESLGDIGYETFVVPKGSYSIVCVGRFVQKVEANILVRKLKERYTDCLIRRL